MVITDRWKALTLSSACAIAPAVISAGPAQGYKFALRTGHGTPVCDAYLARLRAQKFTAPARCGIPENYQNSGFTELKRKVLSTAEIQSLFPYAYKFNRNQNQHDTYDGWVPADVASGAGEGLLARALRNAAESK